MFLPRPQAFLALPQESRELAAVLREALSAQGIEPIEWQPADVERMPVRRAIEQAELVIADVTGGSPWVLAEVGMAVGMGKQVLLFSQERSEAMGPIAAMGLQTAIYQPTDVESVRRYLELWLRDSDQGRLKAAY